MGVGGVGRAVGEVGRKYRVLIKIVHYFYWALSFFIRPFGVRGKTEKMADAL